MTDGRVPIHEAIPGHSGESLKALANDLGFAWPEDLQDQWRCLKGMAIMAAHWRKEYDACHRDTYREVVQERLYQHQQQRLEATVRKLKNTRRAMRQFMVSQVASVREAVAELEAKR